MIVIPMAGLSNRFKNQNYFLPKYMLEAHGNTLFYHSVSSFKKYFKTEKFLFIVLIYPKIENFIINECEKLGLKDYTIVVLQKPTLGQAHTVYLGLKGIHLVNDENITIFNIDTFRWGYQYPENFNLSLIDGYLETFIGTGKNWSNIVPYSPNSSKVVLTAEKKEISKYCCTGLYYWSSAFSFINCFKEIMDASDNNHTDNELYIAPMYNYLINQGADIRFSVIRKNQVIFCGVPSEYESFKKDCMRIL